jgi:hypothetical protein
MEYSKDTIYDVMLDYDLLSEGLIDAKDLPKVIKKLGIMNPEPHLALILRAGGQLPSDTKTRHESPSGMMR